jgi:biopolymer transport protein ExbD
MQIVRQRKAASLLDMTPMIDCVFQLLVFFMLSSSFLTPSLKLTLPQAERDAVAEQEELYVSIDAKGDVYVNHTKIALDRLTEHLKPLVLKSEKKIVTVRGDEAMRYEFFVKVLDAAEASGAAHVSVAHQTGN